MVIKPVLALMGPTASGKTALAERLAEHVDGELISVDSALIYRGLSIGAAKPEYPHHLIHIRDPLEHYTAADFASDAKRCIDDVRARGRHPILVGGSMLYFRALLQGLHGVPAVDLSVRADIEAEAQVKGWPALHQELMLVDPKIAERLHPNHSQRICRALEVYRGTGIPLSHWQRGTSAPATERYECIALCPRDRSDLHARIELRLDAMFQNGLLEEVKALYDRGDLHTGLPAIRAVGYRQVWAYLEGEVSLEECRERALAATRQLAKRQLTWLRSWPDLVWLFTDQDGELLERPPAHTHREGSSPNGGSGEASQSWYELICELTRNF